MYQSYRFLKNMTHNPLWGIQGGSFVGVFTQLDKKKLQSPCAQEQNTHNQHVALEKMNRKVRGFFVPFCCHHHDDKKRATSLFPPLCPCLQHLSGNKSTRRSWTQPAQNDIPFLLAYVFIHQSPVCTYIIWRNDGPYLPIDQVPTNKYTHHYTYVYLKAKAK